MALSVWKIETGEVFWVIAHDSADAVRVLMESNMAEDYNTVEAFLAGEEPRMSAIADDFMLGINDEKLGGKITKSCRCWVEDEGRGYLAGTVW